MRKIKAGYACFGEVNTPTDIINKKCLKAKRLLEEANIELVYTDPIRDDPFNKDVKRAINELSIEDFDFLILCIAGWIPSHAVISVAQEFSHKPMVLWGLAGELKNGVLVTTADQAGTSALRKTFDDMGYTYKFVFETIDTPPKIDQVVQFGKAARARNLLRHSKVGMMGFRDMNLYATLYDGVSLRKRIGPEVEVFEMLEIVRKLHTIDEERIENIFQKIQEKWKFLKRPDDTLIKKGIRYYLAIKDKILEREYDAVSLIDVDGMKRLEQFTPAMIFMLLSDITNIPTIPENDALGAVTQLIVKYLTDQCAAYFEFYEFMKDRVLVGVPDYVPSEVVDGDVIVTTTKFGALSEGILNVSKVKTGKVTLCRLSSSGDKYKMHIVTGNAVTPRKWEEAGWDPPAPQLPGLEIVLDSSVEQFAKNVMSQHYILSYGDNRGVLYELCKMLGIEIV